MAENVYRAPVATSADLGRQVSRRSPLAAGLLSLVVPGSGQLYNGRFVLGAAFFMAAHAIFTLIFGGFHRDVWEWLALATLGAVVVLASTFEAAACARRRVFVAGRLFHCWFVFGPVVALLASVSWFEPIVFSPLRTAAAPWESMQPTILRDELVLVDHAYYAEQPPRRGDVVLLRNPADSIDALRRVIALPGERVEMRGSRAIVDGDPGLDRWGHLNGPPIPRSFSGVVSPGALFVLGDNRSDGGDGPFSGLVTQDRLYGRALSIYFSTDRQRIGKSLKE